MGVLQVVSTPIGNLGDLSPRAADALREADLVLAEDTRRTSVLLRHVGASTRQRSLHEHNERSRIAEILRLLEEGTRIVLVSDAGTPAVSDPGHQLISACVEAGVRVEPIPGPSAMLAALVASGLPSDRVAFEGFLPRKGAARARRLDALAVEERTMVVLASPHRVLDDLSDLMRVLGADRRAALARELTKVHEEFVHGTLGSLADAVRDGVKGEVTLVVAGRPASQQAAVGPDEVVALLRQRIADGESRRDAVAHVAEATGVPRNDVYQAAIEAKL